MELPEKKPFMGTDKGPQSTATGEYKKDLVLVMFSGEFRMYYVTMKKKTNSHPLAFSSNFLQAIEQKYKDTMSLSVYNDKV